MARGALGNSAIDEAVYCSRLRGVGAARDVANTVRSFHDERHRDRAPQNLRRADRHRPCRAPPSRCWPDHRRRVQTTPARPAKSPGRSVRSSKSMGDYLDSHPETNQTMTAMLQQQAGPQSMTGAEVLLRGQPQGCRRHDVDRRSRLTNLSLQCKLPISPSQAMGMMQQAQGAAGGLPALPGNAAGALPLGGTRHPRGHRARRTRAGQPAVGPAAGQHRRLGCRFPGADRAVAGPAGRSRSDRSAACPCCAVGSVSGDRPPRRPGRRRSPCGTRRRTPPSRSRR